MSAQHHAQPHPVVSSFARHISSTGMSEGDGSEDYNSKLTLEMVSRSSHL